MTVTPSANMTVSVKFNPCYINNVDTEDMGLS